MSDFEQYFHTNFGMTFGTFALLFGVIYAYGTVQYRWTLREFWDDQKDEMIICAFAGMAFVIWDEQLLLAIHDLLVLIGWGLSFVGVNIPTLQDLEDFTIEEHHYLMVTPAVLAIYKWKNIV